MPVLTEKETVVYARACVLVEVARGITAQARRLGLIGEDSVEYEDDILVSTDLHLLMASFAASDQVFTRTEKAMLSNVREKIFGFGREPFGDEPIAKWDPIKYCVSETLELAIDLDLRHDTHWVALYRAAAKNVAIAVISVDDDVDSIELSDLERFDEAICEAAERYGINPDLVLNDQTATSIESLSPTPNEALPSEVVSLDMLVAEVDRLVGLPAVKAEVRSLINLLRVSQLRKAQGLPVADVSNHLVFVGNPGTGKTSVARILARVYACLGLLDQGHLVETSRSDFVASYVGQTAIKTTEVFVRARGGVLFIDEAYSLTRAIQGGDYGQEAIDALVKLMEDHRADVVVIAAGYPEEMGTFVDANPGLRSRFKRTLTFEDYNTTELTAIFKTFCDNLGYHLAKGTLDRVVLHLESAPRGAGFGNGRFARQLFEDMLGSQANRLARLASPTAKNLSTLRVEDVPTRQALAPSIFR